jgi:hypothetical protein
MSDKNKTLKICTLILLILLCGTNLNAQLSPGVLSNVHSNLEGLSNCTQCHVLGDKVTNEKCLTCHTEIQSRISAQKGYHSSFAVNGKQCSLCHSEHHGKNFQIIRFDTAKFDHNLTGYNLSAPHAKQECKACHNSQHITDQKIKTKSSTFLGVSRECLTCHTDYHLRTLSSSCLNCHTEQTFVPASKFNHASAKFQLAGKHKSVDCVKCHKIETTAGKKFQQFRGIKYSNCTSCHTDPHKNQFGQNCRQCHSEESFQIVSGLKNFDHNKTDFKLEEKHLIVNCKSCHKTKFTDPLKHDRCTDCHSDYHNKQFVKNNVSPDCSECHTVKGFTSFTFTVEKHNLSRFPLKGAHSATPCYECHKKQEKWSFRNIGFNCNECHTDNHKSFIQTKYYPDADCKICHTENRWSEVKFDHSKTDFKLDGAHIRTDCRSCHYKADSKGVEKQRFTGLSKDCASCHSDNHFKQFEKNGTTDCTICHGTENWKASVFDHNKTAFKLDGKHVNVACAGCHKPEKNGSLIYVKYKLKEFRCESCHF